MCMLTFFPEGVQPDAERLLNGSIYNNDGHGYAIVVPSLKEIIVRKSMDADYLVADFTKMRELFPDGPAMFHSRWGTGGLKTTFNCHPFYVHDRWANSEQTFNKETERFDYEAVTDQTVVGHNGVLSVKQAIDDDRCDTHMAAQEIMGEWYDLSVASERDDVAEWIGPGNKLVFLTVDPRFDRNSYIINEKRGVWDEGVWYSNHDYVGYSKWDRGATFRSYDRYESGTLADGFNPWAGDSCALCGKLGGGVDSDGFCTTCDSCVECIEQRVDCTCYVATTGDKERARQDYIDWWTDAESSAIGVREDVLAAAARDAERAAERDAEIEEKLETISDVLNDLGITRDEIKIWMRKTKSTIEAVEEAVDLYRQSGDAEGVGPKGPSERFDDDQRLSDEDIEKIAKRWGDQRTGTIKGSIVDLRRGSTVTDDQDSFDAALAVSNRRWAEELAEQQLQTERDLLSTKQQLQITSGN